MGNENDDSLARPRQQDTVRRLCCLPLGASKALMGPARFNIISRFRRPSLPNLSRLFPREPPLPMQTKLPFKILTCRRGVSDRARNLVETKKA